MKLCITIFIIVLTFSCSKNEKKEINFTKNIKINLKDKKESDKIDFFYKFDKNITFKVNSFQFFKSKINSFIVNINFNINLKYKEFKNNYHKFELYIDNLKISNKNLLGNTDLSDIIISYNKLLTSTYFNIKLNKFGEKKFIFEKKIDNNPNIRKINYFLENILENIFLNTKLKTNNLNFLVFEDNIEKQQIKYQNKYFYNNKNILLKLTTKDKLKKIYFLYSKKDELPLKVNYQNNASYEIKLDGTLFNYKLKNYYFIEKL